MRILHVVTNIWRCNGVMSIVMNYLRHMPEDIRFDILYFTELEDNYREELESLGGAAFHISPPGLHSFLRDDVDAFLSAHQGVYAAIHLHLPYLASVFAHKARKYGISKVYVHCHSTWFSLEPRNRLLNQLLNLPTKYLADQLFACGQEAGAFWYGHRAVKQGDVKVLPNAIDSDRYRFAPKRRKEVRVALGVEDCLVVGHVGRVLPPQKNHTFLLKVFAHMLRQRPDAVLLLVGAEENEELGALSRELGIQNAVRWLGLRSDVPNLLQAMDIFVFPSFYEGLPVSAVEAESAGLPVLMSDRITDEVCVTDERIARLPLEMSAEEWAKKALELSALERIDTADQVVRAGFDLKTSATWLADFYRNRA